MEEDGSGRMAKWEGHRGHNLPCRTMVIITDQLLETIIYFSGP